MFSLSFCGTFQRIARIPEFIEFEKLVNSEINRAFGAEVAGKNFSLVKEKWS